MFRRAGALLNMTACGAGALLNMTEDSCQLSALSCQFSVRPAGRMHRCFVGLRPPQHDSRRAELLQHDGTSISVYEQDGLHQDVGAVGAVRPVSKFLR